MGPRQLAGPGGLGPCMALTVKRRSCLCVLAFVWMYQQRELPVLFLDLIYCCVEWEVQLLKRVELESP